MKLFIDANVLVAVLNREYPLFTYASQIMSLADRPNIGLFASPLSIAIAFFFSAKKSGVKTAKKKIQLMLKHVAIATMDGSSIQVSLQDVRILDLEDGMQHRAAIDANCDVLVTENIADFHFNSIPVLNCKEALLHVQRKA